MNMETSKLVNFNTLEGLTITKIDGLKEYSEEVIFHTKEKRTFKLFHNYDCCENVLLADICGTTALTGKVLSATMKNNIGKQNVKTDLSAFDDCSTTWTFYDIQTNKGFLTLRWFGNSNGCYSEEACFIEFKI